MQGVCRNHRRGQEGIMNRFMPRVDTQHQAARGFVLSNLDKPQRAIDLPEGQGWAFRGKRQRQTLYCMQGCIWVTQEGDIRDYLLEAGDAFQVTLTGLVLVRALRDSHIGYRDDHRAVPFKGRFSQTVFN
jgi:hypothetical protein